MAESGPPTQCHSTYPAPDTLSERAATLLQHDISGRPSRARLAAWHRRPGAALRDRRHAAARRTVAADVTRPDYRHRPARFSRRRHQPGGSARTSPRMRSVVEMEALRLAIDHGDDAWEAGILSALHQMRRHIERTGDEFREGAPDFDRAAQGISHRIAGGLRFEAPARGAFRPLRSGLSLPPRDDALASTAASRFVRSPSAARPIACLRAKSRSCAGHAGSASALDRSPSSIHPDRES